MAGEVLSGPFLHKRGATDKVAAYTGPLGEIVIDSGKKTISVQDGTTQGGTLLVNENRTLTPGTGVQIDGATAAANLSANRTISVKFDDLVSSKTGNTLVLASDGGEDGKLFVPAVNVNDLIDSNDELLHVDGTSGKIATGLDFAYNTTTGKLDITNYAGTVVATVTIPSSVSMLESAELVTNPAGQPAGTYFHFVFRLADNTTSDLYVDVTSLIDIYTAGAGIDITSNKVSVDLTTGGGLEMSAVGDAGTLQVKMSDLVSADAGNAIEVSSTDGKLFVDPGVVVSTDTGNIITAGTDGGALLKLAASNNAAELDTNGALIVPLDCGVLS